MPKPFNTISFFLLNFIQARAFTQWFDWHVAKRDYFIQDLEHDICDGVLLVNLLEILSGYDLGAYHDKPQVSVPYPTLYRLIRMHT